MTRPILRIELPDAERGRAPATIRRWDKLQRKLRNPKLTPKEREIVMAELHQIEAMPAARANEAWAKAALAESAELARCRGERVTDDGNTRRFLDRDPLVSLARSGKITADQLETGLAVRDLYDRRREGMGTGEFTGMPGAAHNHEAFVLRGFTRARATAMVVRVEMAVHDACRHEPAALTMLRAICEDGLPITSGGKGRNTERNAGAFALALDVAETVLRRQA